MSISTGNGSSASTPMLLLAAIDMLTAALVCSVVLFVVLVGGQAESAMAVSGESATSAPSIVELITVQGAGAPPTLERAEPISGTASPIPDELAQQFLTGGPLHLTTYYLKPGVHELTLQNVAVATEVLIHDGTGPVQRLALRCGAPGATITVRMLPRLEPGGICAADLHQTQSLNFQPPTQAVLVQSAADADPPPPGWSRVSSEDFSNGSRLTYVKAIAPAAVPSNIRIVGIY